MIDNNANVQLIHYNDSKYGWNSRADRHEFIGMGKIPWIFLEEMGKLASFYNIYSHNSHILILFLKSNLTHDYLNIHSYM